LLPVWGVAFVRQFLNFCLPTLLAPGNIPALALALPTRLVLLTHSSDVPLIAQHPAWHQLAQHCDTELQHIDDLIVDGNHHAAITLAYVRALRAAGAALRDTAFIFLVADYLLADGSLRSVLDRIQGGASGVLAGSLEISTAAAAPLLARRGAASHELVLPPRVLVDWALAHVDPRSAANIVNTGLLHDAETNRLFWSVDKHTRIGRFYLLHMIAIRPEVSDFVVGAPCDYAFIPELCPSSNVAVLTDSDDYLAVELQRGAARQLHSGPTSPTRLARSLSQWTTARHRQNADATLVFHARDVPEKTGETSAVASRFIGEIGKALTREPQPHRGHPSWIGMMALQRAGGGLPEDYEHVVSSTASRETASERTTSRLWRLRLGVLGHPPNVTACHPRWPDFHAVYLALRSRLRSGDRLLVLSASAPSFARWLKPLCPEITASEWELLPNFRDASRGSAPLFDACLWVPEREQLDNPAASLDRIVQALNPEGRLLIFAVEDLDADPLDAIRICTGLASARQFALCMGKIYYIPVGRLRRALARALAATMRAQRGRSRVFLPILLAACALIVGAVSVGNLAIWRRRSSMPTRGNWSSILLVGDRAQHAKPAIAGQNGLRNEAPKSTSAHRAGGLSADVADVEVLPAAIGMVEKGVGRARRR
jgi:hypothetical protein